MRKQKLITLLALSMALISSTAKAGEKRHYNSSISVQVGVNGTLQESKYDLVFLPPDLAYSHELFDNDVFN